MICAWSGWVGQARSSGDWNAPFLFPNNLTMLKKMCRICLFLKVLPQFRHIFAAFLPKSKVCSLAVLVGMGGKIMCGFKQCGGSGGCFLAGVSPCPNAPAEKSDSLTRLGIHYDGFLEPNLLLSALGFEENSDLSAVLLAQDRAA